MHSNIRSRAHRLVARMDPDQLASIQAQASKDAAAHQSAIAAGQTPSALKDDSSKYPTYIRPTQTAAATTPAAVTPSAPAAAQPSKAVPNSADTPAAKNTPVASVPSSDEPKRPTAHVGAPAPAQSSDDPAPAPAASKTPTPAVQSTDDQMEVMPSTEDKATPSVARSPVSTSSEALEAESPASSASLATSANRKLLSSSSLSASPASTTATRGFQPIAASSAAATAAASSAGMSGGAIAGIVIAVLLGAAALAIIGAWYMRQKRRQERQVNNPWRNMNNPSDDNITPFPAYSEKPDDYYGDNDAPVIGSNRALALARQNAFYADGTPRPDSTAMNPNFAGYGAGRSYGPYPTANGGPGTPHSHHFSEQHQQYQDNPFHDQYQYQDDAQLVQLHDHSGPRQLVGPGQAYGAGGVPVPVPAPVPLGRPEAPQTYDDIAEAEAYADDRYADDHQHQHGATAMPTAMATGTAGQFQQGPHHHQGQHHGQQAYSEQGHLIDTASSDEQHMPEPTPLPQLRPMSPLLVDVDQQSSVGHGQSNLGTAMPVTARHSGPSSEEMDRMYNEVANYAGVPQPDGSVHGAGMDQGLQEATRLPPQPYVHGQPLTPLTELPTPKSETASLAPAPMPVPQVQQSAPRALPTPPQQQQQQQAQAPKHHEAEEDAYGGI